MTHNEAGPPPPPGVSGPAVTAWHYVRANDPAYLGSSSATGPVSPGRAWNFVYPGRYDASAANNRRHQGTEAEAPWDPETDPEPWATMRRATPIKLGVKDDLNSRERGTRPSFPATTIPPPTASFAIQIANGAQSDQFNVTNAGPAFPFNGYPRSGDLMQATFIGSYTIEEDVSP